VTRLSRGILAFGAYIRVQLAFGYIALVDLRLTLDKVSKVGCLIFVRYLPHDLIEAGCGPFLPFAAVINCTLSGAKQTSRGLRRSVAIDPQRTVISIDRTGRSGYGFALE
jgi:hypothetical protein